MQGNVLPIHPTMTEERQERPKDTQQRTIFVLGSGVIGLTAAHVLSEDPANKITVLARELVDHLLLAAEPDGVRDEGGVELHFAEVGGALLVHCLLFWRHGRVRASRLDLLDDREFGQAGAVADLEVDFFLQESISLSSKVTLRVRFKGTIRCDRYVREFAEELHLV